MEDTGRDSEGSTGQGGGKGDNESGGVVGGAYNLDTAQKVSGGGGVGGGTSFGASAGADQETGGKVSSAAGKGEWLGNSDTAQNMSGGGDVVGTAHKVSDAGASVGAAYNPDTA
jgi:hypothetical protein